MLYTATGEKTYTGRYVTDVVTDLAIDFIRERPRDKPFFLMLHHKAPHRPWEPDPAHRAQFADRWIPEPETLWDNYATRTDALRENQQRVAGDLTRRDLKLEPPADLSGTALAAWLSAKPDTVTTTRDGREVTLTGEALTRWKYQRYMRDYLATIQSVDDNVGRLLEALDTERLAKNTIVIYTSDQGFFLGDHGMYDKRFMYEESLRMPFLIRWPAAIKRGQPQRRDGAERGLRADVSRRRRACPCLPTCRAAACCRCCAASRRRTGARRCTTATTTIPAITTRARITASGRATHKLIHYWKKDQWELFDLVRDPHELHNLYGQPGHDEVTRSLKAELQRLKQAVRDEDQFANEQLPNGVDGAVAKLRGK